MAKESGMGMTVSVDDSGGVARAIGNDITSIDFSTPRGVQDITGLDKSAIERLLLLADGTVTLNGVFNDALNMSHDVFKTVPSSSVIRTVTITVSGKVLAMEMYFSDYALSRAASGELTWVATGQLGDGATPTWA
uniref:Uncharacterized protein n=1 Tax=viral metagenome TaxID=1070528 RepID=A0A6M3XKW9_9ZZZZ